MALPSSARDSRGLDLDVRPHQRAARARRAPGSGRCRADRGCAPRRSRRRGRAPRCRRGGRRPKRCARPRARTRAGARSGRSSPSAALAATTAATALAALDPRPLPGAIPLSIASSSPRSSICAPSSSVAAATPAVLPRASSVMVEPAPSMRAIVTPGRDVTVAVTRSPTVGDGEAEHVEAAGDVRHRGGRERGGARRRGARLHEARSGAAARRRDHRALAAPTVAARSLDRGRAAARANAGRGPAAPRRAADRRRRRRR